MILCYLHKLTHIYRRRQLLYTVQEEAAKQGLQINVGKTKTLRPRPTHATPIKIGVEFAEDVSTFTYLGSVITKSGGAEADVEARIRKAQTAEHCVGI